VIRFSEIVLEVSEDLVTLAGEHGSIGAVAAALGLDADELAGFAASHAERPDAHPPAHQFQVALLLGMLIEKRLRA